MKHGAEPASNDRLLRGYRCVLFLPLFIAVNACVDRCTNVVTDESLSPNGGTKIVVFERDCGATTPGGVHVSLLPYNSSLADEGGNVLSLSRGTGADVSVEWLNDNAIRITHDSQSIVSHKVVRYRGTPIEYVIKSKS